MPDRAWDGHFEYWPWHRRADGTDARKKTGRTSPYVRIATQILEAGAAQSAGPLVC